VNLYSLNMVMDYYTTVQMLPKAFIWSKIQ